jgi:DNA-binding Xre family transcriptional regulator
MDVSKSLRVALAMRGMKQVELARKMGMSEGWVRHLAARKSANTNTVTRVAKALDFKVSEFMALGEE